MIPKKIHYCWFGRKRLPRPAEKCLASWRKFCPDFEIVRWDESNYDVNKIPYVGEAYAAGKFPFVSDYARFDLLYRHGGLYFDTDVEIIRNLTPLIAAGPFMGCEPAAGGGMNPAPGLGLAAMPGSELFREILAAYALRHFCLPDGKMDLTTVVDFTANILCRHGFSPEKTEIQECCGFKIYPPEYFCPQPPFEAEPRLTANTCSIHHYAASWMPARAKIKKQTALTIKKYFPRLWPAALKMKRFCFGRAKNDS